MEILLLIVGIVMICAALAYAFASDALASGCACAYLGVMALNSSRYVTINSDQLIFWAIAVLILLVARWFGARQSAVTARGRRFVAVGALAGMMAGAALGGIGSMIAGSAIGAVLGLFAFSRNPAAMLSGRRLCQAALDLALPMVVLMSMVGLVVISLV